MALRINPFLKSNNDTGFGNYTSGYGGRFVNRDGSFNVRREGVAYFDKVSIYHKLLTMSRWKFLTVLLTFFISINLVFSLLYLLAGLDQLQGYLFTSVWGKMREVFYFSCQTFTTVGYGRVNPVGDTANLIASFEAMCGFLTFAVITGLLYGRFTRPRANLRFSSQAIIAPYQQGTGLMFRFVSVKDSHFLTSVEVSVTMAMQVEENGKPVYKFYSLDLERKSVDSLPMNFTVVHPITEASPIWQFDKQALVKADVELYILIKAFDDVYSTTVQQRTSYVAEEIVYGAKFDPMYHESEDGKTTWIEVQKLSSFKPVALPQW